MIIGTTEIKFIDNVEEKYPKDLILSRNRVEGNLIACLWKEPELYSDLSDLKEEDFITVDGRFYYNLGNALKGLGYKNFDTVTVSTFLSDKPVLKTEFESKSGYKFIKDFVPFINIDNTDTYYDEIRKNNILLRLHDKGFEVIKEMPKFNKMTSEDVFDYFEYQLNNIFVKVQVGAKIENVVIDDAFLQSCDLGEELGVSYGSACPLLSYTTGGIHKRNLMVIGGYSGTGKTSFCVHSIILPLLEQGAKFAIISNEQNIKEYKRLLLGTVLSTRIGYYKMQRKKLQTGGFTKEDWEAIHLAKEYINSFSDSLKFVQLYDYDINGVKKIIKKLSKEGYEYFLYDTFKSDDLSSDRAWGNMVEGSKELFQVANKENVGIIATMQLAIHTIDTRYLTANCLSTAKQIKEVCSELILLRNVWTDEYTGMPKDLKAFRHPKDSDGKFIYSTKQDITLDKDKKYVLMFVDKTRSGESDIQFLYQLDMHFNRWTELGWARPQRY